MTFSICARCDKTAMVGVGIMTSSISVGARCPWVKSGVGAVATQNITLPSLGGDVLDAMTGGADAQRAVDAALRQDTNRDYRQVIAIDGSGGSGVFTGAHMLGIHAAAAGDSCIAAGNLLADAGVPAAMTAAFTQHAAANLPERILCALEAGLQQGGEQGPVHSCALLVADEQRWPLVDLRVDWDETNPLAALRLLWEKYQPQMREYVVRALAPRQAPSYGVPGDE